MITSYYIPLTTRKVSNDLYRKSKHTVYIQYSPPPLKLVPFMR